ncbi:MAG: hypothetical protein CMJ46_15495, partial [Planctomyces sp.]|nr:hypothetical protein [Planctomyces sp.]
MSRRSLIFWAFFLLAAPGIRPVMAQNSPSFGPQIAFNTFQFQPLVQPQVNFSTQQFQSQTTSQIQFQQLNFPSFARPIADRDTRPVGRPNSLRPSRPAAVRPTHDLSGTPPLELSRVDRRNYRTAATSSSRSRVSTLNTARQQVAQAA